MSMYGGCAAAGRRAVLFALGFLAFAILLLGLLDLDLERDLERDLDLDRERDLGKTTDILITNKAGEKKLLGIDFTMQVAEFHTRAKFIRKDPTSEGTVLCHEPD